MLLVYLMFSENLAIFKAGIYLRIYLVKTQFPHSTLPIDSAICLCWILFVMLESRIAQMELNDSTFQYKPNWN